MLCAIDKTDKAKICHSHWRLGYLIIIVLNNTVLTIDIDSYLLQSVITNAAVRAIGLALTRFSRSNYG